MLLEWRKPFDKACHDILTDIQTRGGHVAESSRESCSKRAQWRRRWASVTWEAPRSTTAPDLGTAENS